MDDADRAEEAIENARQDGIARARRAPTLDAIGTCWYCAEPLLDGRRFCNKDCCQSYETELLAIKRAGRRIINR